MIIVTRQCVASKDHVPRSKVKVMADTSSLGIQNRVQPITSFQTLVGFENYLAEMIITTRQCVVYKNHVARSKVKVTVHTHSLYIGISCSAHNFILHGWI